MVSVEELEDHFLECIDIIEDDVDKTDYRNILLPLLFYKAVNDTYRDEFEAKKEEYGEEIAKDESYHRIQLPEDCYWQELLKQNKNVDRFLNKTFDAIERANPGKLDGIFGTDFVDADIENWTLKELVQHLDTQSLSLEQVEPSKLGEAYRILVMRFAIDEDREPGEFYTPDGIIDVMVRFLGPFSDGDQFHDPTTGSGDMLIETAKYYRKELDGDPKKLRLTGQEDIKDVPAMAKINFFFNDLDAEIEEGNPLTEPQFTQDGQLSDFDFVLTNFPFSEDWAKEKLRDDSYGRFNWTDKFPAKNRADYAFIMHMYECLKDDGVMASVVPHGVLFRQYEDVFRKPLIEWDVVEAVIGVPEKLFGEDTGIAPAILLLNRDKPEEREGEVFFLHADDEDFYRELSNKNEMTEEGVKHIVENFREWKTEERVSRVVDIDEIEENDYNLNIALYVDTTEPEEDINTEEEFEKLLELEDDLQQLKERRDKHIQELYDRGNQT